MTTPNEPQAQPQEAPETPERLWVIKSPWGLHPQWTKPVKSRGVEYVRCATADDKGLKKLAVRIIDTVLQSPCVVETRCFSQLEEVDRLETQVTELLSTSRATEGELIVEAAQEYERRIAELERRLRIPFGKFPCALCGGPHDFDTSVPSVIWNQVIRAKGLPDYLCTACIVREFVREGQSFTAELWNEEFNGVPIEVIINGQIAKDAALIQEENNALRNRLSETAEILTALGELRTMFPLYVIAIKIKVGRTRSNVPHYWIDIEGKYSPSVGTETLEEAMQKCRTWAKSRESKGEKS
jgi:hypothetical protein